MQKLFNKILLPIDFSSRSKTVIEKAVAIAQAYHCSIHLLHIVIISPFSAIAMEQGHLAMPINSASNTKELRFQLEQLCNDIRLSDPTIKVACSILQGTWDEAIIEFVNQHKMDLVLIGQKGQTFLKRSMLLNPDKIAAKTNIPVITIPANRRVTKLYSIVIPITDFLPVRKLMYGVYIASNYDTTVKLLGIENEKTKDKVQYYMEKAYQIIRENCNIKVELEKVVSKNVADAVNRFAILKSVDLVIVNPGSQTKMPGFLSAMLGNIIQRYSAPPVLTVNPV